MFKLILIVLPLVGLSGLIVKYGVERWSRATGEYYQQYYHLDWKEYATALVLMCAVITPVIYRVGDHLSVAEQLKYWEWYNGVETTAVQNVTTCVQGHSSHSSASSGHSNCNYTYDCGDYTYYTRESREVPDGVDKDGHPKTRTEYYDQAHHADIYCPYLTREYRYQIFDSLPGGDHTLPGVYGALQPVAWGGRGIPSNIPLGPPEEWVKSKQRLDAGDPRSVERLFSYDNYILAAQDDMLLPYSEDVDRYLNAGVLPEHTKNILGDPTYGPLNSTASKVSFVGVKPPGGDEKWQEALNGLNAALGMKLHGDMHLVVIDDKLVDSHTNYLNALKAYWLGDHFGRRAIAKNAIVVVVGVKGDTVKWAEASTGMPLGNEVMLRQISLRFTGSDTPLTPNAVIGNPRLRVTGSGDNAKAKMTLAESPGILEKTVLKDYPFVRASMGCKGGDDGKSCLGYDNLVSKIEPSGGAKVAMGAAALFIALILWGLAVPFDWFGWLSDPKGQSVRRSQRLTDRGDFRTRRRY